MIYIHILAGPWSSPRRRPGLPDGRNRNHRHACGIGEQGDSPILTQGHRASGVTRYPLRASRGILVSARGYPPRVLLA
jgi:hypothetical protein